MKGAVLNYTDYGAKGNENGQTIHTFKEVTGKDGNTPSIKPPSKPTKP